jgi:PPK2 family polyphosphate:nucleotide phosphotransferase
MIDLNAISTLPPADAHKKECKKELKKIKKELFSLQNKFYADGRFGLLIILHGVDTSGKDGTIRHAFTSMNPTGVHVTSFKAPVGQELEHDFLWRIYPHIPGKGIIGVFNRSYYEDILVPSLNKSLSKEDIQHRCKFINELEEHLVRNNIHVLKFFLHLSKDEQKKKLEDRKTNPRKNWKYSLEDRKAPAEWKANMETYDMLIEGCSELAWNIIPSDKRWYRNFKVAEILFNHLNSLNLKYPQS